MVAVARARTCVRGGVATALWLGRCSEQETRTVGSTYRVCCAPSRAWPWKPARLATVLVEPSLLRGAQKRPDMAWLNPAQGAAPRRVGASGSEGRPAAEPGSGRRARGRRVGGAGTASPKPGARHTDTQTHTRKERESARARERESERERERGTKKER